MKVASKVMIQLPQTHARATSSREQDTREKEGLQMQAKTAQHAKKRKN